MDKLFEEPHVWWIAQITKYLLRLKPEYEKIVNNTINKLGFENPIVGIHVRRGNKKTEIDYQPLDKYMQKVKEFYDVLELSRNVSARRVFISTDDELVIKEAMEKYPDYKILLNQDSSNNKAQKYETQTMSSLGILIESQLMSKCDFLVVTLSSNLGRRYYEYLYWTRKDAKERIKSLDYRHYENFESPQMYKVIIKNNGKTADQLSAEVSDVVTVAGLFDKDGVLLVENHEGKKGLIPSFKLERIGETVEFPNYENTTI